MTTCDVTDLERLAKHERPHGGSWSEFTAARSITTRVFTTEEHAQAHCQVGNLPLALRVISDWVAASTAARKALG